MNGNLAGRLFAGLVVIGVGVIFLLRQLGIVSISIGELFSTYWPCILIFFGLIQLLTGSSQGGSNLWGAIPLTIGVIFLGNKLGWFDWSIGDLIPYAIPFIIIFVGMRMIWKPRSKQQSPPSDDWKSYRPYQNDSPVPPAPPLHPDPTGIDGDMAEGSYEDPNKNAAKHAKGTHNSKGPRHSDYGQHSSYDYSDDSGYSDSMSGGQYKKGKSCNQWNDHHKEHVEWWNHSDPNVMNRSGFIGDIHMGHDHWELKPLNISHFIGDTVLDLTKAQIPFGETRISISSFIGDVKVYVPNDFELGVQVVTSAFIGDVKVLGQKEGGMFTNVRTQSTSYPEADKKIKIVVSTFIGDTRVTKVG